MSEIVHNTFEVLQFMKSIMPFNAAEGMYGIGLKKDGEYIAGCMFEGINPYNAWVHLAAVPTKRWMTKQYLRECFGFAFDTLGVRSLRGYVNASNTEALKLNDHFGYERETVLKGAAPDGGDVILYVMRKEGCRFISEISHG